MMENTDMWKLMDGLGAVIEESLREIWSPVPSSFSVGEGGTGSKLCPGNRWLRPDL